VDLRAQVVDAHRAERFKPEAVLMHGAAWTLARSWRLAVVESASAAFGRMAKHRETKPITVDDSKDDWP
jgi:hypothetical protein